MQELSHFILAAVYPTSRGSIVAQITRFGSAVYNDQEFGVGYCKKLGAMDVGIKFNLHHTNIWGYGRRWQFIPEAATLFHITQKAHLGFRLYNSPFNNSTFKERAAYEFNVGFGYEVSEAVILGMNVFKPEDKSSSFSASIYYKVRENFFLTSGLSYSNGAFFLGAGWRQKRLEVGVSCHYQMRLGLGNGLMVVYQKGEG